MRRRHGWRRNRANQFVESACRTDARKRHGSGRLQQFKSRCLDMLAKRLVAFTRDKPFFASGQGLKADLGRIQQLSMATDFGKSRRHVVASYWQQIYCRVQIPLPVSPRITSAFCHWIWQANRCSMDCLTIAGPRCAIRLRASRLSTSHASRAVRSKFRQAPRPWAGKDA